jgi:hypothetical protein
LVLVPPGFNVPFSVADVVATEVAATTFGVGAEVVNEVIAPFRVPLEFVETSRA